MSAIVTANDALSAIRQSIVSGPCMFTLSTNRPGRIFVFHRALPREVRLSAAPPLQCEPQITHELFVVCRSPRGAAGCRISLEPALRVNYGDAPYW